MNDDEDVGMRSAEGRVPFGHALLACAAGGTVGLGAGALVMTRPFTPAPWDEAPPHPASIYGPGASEGAEARTRAVPLVSPFHLQTDPMEGLFLASFERDPDRIYVGFEPQAFDDRAHGSGILVIGWRVRYHEWPVTGRSTPGARLGCEGSTLALADGGLSWVEHASFG